MAIRRGRSATSGFFRDFQNFILRGNVIDLAVAVVIGGAFGKIVDSLVTDIVTPALLKPALETARVDDLAKLSLGGILYGKFLAAIINFLVIALVIFVIIRIIEALKRREEVKAEETPVIPDPQERLISAMAHLADTIESKA